MYEIWLAMNIVWEIALGVWPGLLALGLLMLLLWALALRRGTRAHWRSSLAGAAAAGLLAAVALVLTLPLWSQSNLGELAYWVDWAYLAALCAGAAGLAMLLAWPLLALALPPRARQT